MSEQKRLPRRRPPKSDELPARRPPQDSERDTEIDDLVKEHLKRDDSKEYTERRREKTGE